MHEWHRETCYAGSTDWVLGSFKTEGSMAHQFVKDYLRAHGSWNTASSMPNTQNALGCTHFVLTGNGPHYRRGCGPQDRTGSASLRYERNHDGYLHTRSGRSETSRVGEIRVKVNSMTITGRKVLVGPNGLEPSTSSVSGRRSNQLSYGPIRALRLLLPTVPAFSEPSTTLPCQGSALTN